MRRGLRDLAPEHESLDRGLEGALSEFFHAGLVRIVDAAQCEARDSNRGGGREVEQCEATADQRQHGEALTEIKGLEVATCALLDWELRQKRQQRHELGDQAFERHAPRGRFGRFERGSKAL